MMLCSKRMQALLLPHFMSRFRLFWLKPERMVETVDAMERNGALVLIKDFDGVAHMIMESDADLLRDQVASRVLRQLSPTKLKFLVCSPISAEAFATSDTRSLKDLWLYVLLAPVSVPFRRFPTLPALERLHYSTPEIHLQPVEAIDNAAPLLQKIWWLFWPFMSNIPAAQLPRRLQAATASWKISSLAELRNVAGLESFRPGHLELYGRPAHELVLGMVEDLLTAFSWVEELGIHDDYVTPDEIGMIQLPPFLRKLSISSLNAFGRRGADLKRLRIRLLNQYPMITPRIDLLLCMGGRDWTTSDWRALIRDLNVWREIGALERTRVFVFGHGPRNDDLTSLAELSAALDADETESEDGDSCSPCFRLRRS